MNYDEHNEHEGDDADFSGIEFIPLNDIPSLDDAAFALFETDSEQVLKTPFGMIKISIEVSADMGDLAQEIKGMFTNGLSVSGIEKLNQIIKASPDVAKVVSQVPGLKHFLDMALKQMKEETRESGAWNPGAMTWQRLAASANLN